MAWAIEYHEMASKDLHKLDKTQWRQVLKAIGKVARNPLPNYEGGHGKPLGNRATLQLAGYYKIDYASQDFGWYTALSGSQYPLKNILLN